MALAVMDLTRAVAVAKQRSEMDGVDPAVIRLMDQMASRKRSVDSEQTRFNVLADRWDNLYYPQGFTLGGASHWADHESAKLRGRSHVSVNIYPVYVDVPAAMQAVPPIENMVGAPDDMGKIEDNALLANALERVYTAWKAEEEFDLKNHKACVVKSLYGRTAAKVYWDDNTDKPTVEIVDNPRNLFMGWKNSNYTELEWAMYTYRITPTTAMEDWGLVIGQGEDRDGTPYPFVANPTAVWSYPVEAFTTQMVQTDLEVEVYDYWYRRPKKGAKIRFGKPTVFETWNAVFVGNALVAHVRHPEYKGKMPYVPLFNTFIPGMPDGRSELWDIEQLVREKDERYSETAQMISNAINGQFWQWTGPNAGYTVPRNLKPRRNGVVGPGPDNRLEAITPWMPEFQAEAYMARIDRDLADVSGLNDLIRGMAPNAVLNSGKAIAALVANYEMRIRMKRELFYQWRGRVWDLATDVWAEKRPALRPIMNKKIRLEILAPSLTPRDDAEVATIAGNLKELKLISAKRAMDRVGVDDPETEQDIIRDEQTDATLNPQAVQVMAQLLGILQAQGIQPQQAVMDAAGQQAQSLADTRALAPGVVGQSQLNAQGEQPVTPNEQLPGNVAGGPAVPGAPEVGAQDLTLQTALREGVPSSRILQQQRVTTQAKGG